MDENQKKNPHSHRRPLRFELPQQTTPAWANCLCFIGTLAVVGGLALVLPKPTYSEAERRKLAEKPMLTAAAYFSGDYTSQADSYYADTFPGREQLVQMGAFFGENRGLRMDDIRIHEVASSTPAEPPQSQPAQEPDNIDSTENPGQSDPSAPMDDGIAPEKSGSIFIYKGKGLSIFGGSQAMGKWYADTLNQYAKALEGVQIYNLLIPTNIEFALPEKYQSITSPQKPNIDYIYSQLDPSIKRVDAYSKLSDHRDEYIYFNTDHHWTVRGAYYAYTAFCETAGFDPVPLESFTMRRKEPFLGTLYNETQDSKLRETGDYVEYPVLDTPHQTYMYMRNQPYTPYASTIMAEYAQGVNSYSVFLHGDQPLMEIQTENKNGRKIVLVKESFGNALAPFLIHHFETVYVVDQRYFQRSLVPFIQEKGVTDLLFANNIFAANTPYHIRMIEDLMYRKWTPPAPSEPETSEPESSEPASGELEEPEHDPDMPTEMPVEDLPMVIEPEDDPDRVVTDWVDDEE